ncbi:hypothetical protein HK104_009124, partial [Borealophlyctis nickersoniae]
MAKKKAGAVKKKKEELAEQRRNSLDVNNLQPLSRQTPAGDSSDSATDPTEFASLQTKEDQFPMPRRAQAEFKSEYSPYAYPRSRKPRTTLSILYTAVELEVLVGTAICGLVNRSRMTTYFLYDRVGFTYCQHYPSAGSKAVITPAGPPAPLPDPTLLKPVVLALINGTSLPSGAAMHEHRLNLKRMALAIGALKLERGDEMVELVKTYNKAALTSADLLSAVGARHKVTLAQTRSTLESLAELIEPAQKLNPGDLAPITRDDVRRHFIHIADDLDKLYVEASKAQEALRICDEILWDLAAIAANQSATLKDSHLALQTKDTFINWITQINKNTGDVILREQLRTAVGHLAAFSAQVDEAHVVVANVMQAVTDYRKKVEAYGTGIAGVGIRELPMDKQLMIVRGLLEQLD